MNSTSIPISNKPYFTSYVFYDYLLPKIKESLQRQPDSLIHLDLSYTEKISPLVLPNIIVVGRILKLFFKRPVELILNGKNLSLIQFLSDIGFFRVLDENEIFNYERGFVGDFKRKKYGDLGFNLIIPLQEISQDELIGNIFTHNQKLGNFIRHFENAQLANLFISTLGELVHNGMFHGKSDVHISGYGGPKMGLHCALSDCGIGFCRSLLEKSEELKVFPKEKFSEDSELKNFHAILEATFKRFDKKTYGLARVINGIATMGGTTRVHSFDTQVVFTPRLLSKAKEATSVQTAGNFLAAAMLNTKGTTPSLQSKPVRVRNSKLAGVHIEFEIPAI